MTQSISVTEFTELCTQVLSTQGFSDEEVKACTDEFVDAQCRGINTHGASIIMLYLEFMLEGVLGPIEIVKDTPMSAFINGNNNAGPAVARRAMDIAIDKARASGVAIVGANNRAPFCCAGFNPRRAAEQGLIGINFSVGGYIDFPAYGSMEQVMASNPTGIAVPTNDGPVVLDMSFSSLGGGAGSRAGVRTAREAEFHLPEGSALSKEGLPTTDPDEVLEGIVTLFGGHKGSGLSLMMDLIARPFLGGKIENDNPRIRSMTFIAIRPDLFVSTEQFLNDATELAANVKASRPRPGFDEVMLPGQNSDRELARTLRDGIAITDNPKQDKTGSAISRKVYEQLKQLAVEKMDEIPAELRRKLD
jgi:L-2-hydroxycarboxylate dehydrogenase (NAD+)